LAPIWTSTAHAGAARKNVASSANKNFMDPHRSRSVNDSATTNHHRHRRESMVPQITHLFSFDVLFDIEDLNRQE